MAGKSTENTKSCRSHHRGQSLEKQVASSSQQRLTLSSFLSQISTENFFKILENLDIYLKHPNSLSLPNQVTFPVAVTQTGCKIINFNILHQGMKISDLRRGFLIQGAPGAFVHPISWTTSPSRTSRWSEEQNLLLHYGFWYSYRGKEKQSNCWWYWNNIYRRQELEQKPEPEPGRAHTKHGQWGEGGDLEKEQCRDR